MATAVEPANSVRSPGINAEGLPTIQVSGHEVPVTAYMRVVELAETGRSTGTIVNQILVGTESGPIDRHSMAAIVKSILENIRIMNSPPPSPPPNGLKRGSLLFGHLMPKKISSYRASRIASETDLSASLEKLKSAEKAEDTVLNQTLRVASQRDTVNKMMAEGWHKRKTEAALDVELNKYLKRHEVAEAELGHAMKIVQLNRASLR